MLPINSIESFPRFIITLSCVNLFVFVLAAQSVDLSFCLLPKLGVTGPDGTTSIFGGVCKVSAVLKYF